MVHTLRQHRGAITVSTHRTKRSCVIESVTFRDMSADPRHGASHRSTANSVQLAPGALRVRVSATLRGRFRRLGGLPIPASVAPPDRGGVDGAPGPWDAFDERRARDSLGVLPPLEGSHRMAESPLEAGAGTR